MPNETIHRFTGQVGVAVVPRVFLDHVGQDVAQPEGGTGRSDRCYREDARATIAGGYLAIAVTSAEGAPTPAALMARMT